jgi:hypothetical protein
MDTIPRGADGYFHPKTEDELRGLILRAGATGKKLRVRGSSHSVSGAIYADGFDGSGVPVGADLEIMLDGYRAITITPDPTAPGHAIVEVEAGCNLGKNPYDPTRTSTWENSLNYQLQQRGYALDDLGGISHQTISGFLSTGSSGGSIQFSIDDNITRLRFIDGTGAVHDVARDDADLSKRDLFAAAGVSMGLLGVLSKIWLRARPTYNLVGQQATTSTDAAAMDLFGPGSPGKPSLSDYLKQTPYSRLMWWPQHGFERMQVWEAARVEPTPDFVPKPYEELGGAPQLASLAGSLFYTLVGNLDDLASVPAKLTNWYAHLEGDIEGAPDVNANAYPGRMTSRPKYTVLDVLDWIRTRLAHTLSRQTARYDADPAASQRGQGLLDVARATIEGSFPHSLANAVTKLIELLLDGALESFPAKLLARWLEREMPYVIDSILDPFVTLGTDTWQDTWMCGLPMDNQMDDQLWPTEFTELWIPIEKTAEVMRALRDFYAGEGDAKIAYDHTGAFSCELYATAPSPFWMSPSYGGAVFRVDVFWFALNAGKPGEHFYPRFWSLLKDFAFRPHWGKHLPDASPEWRAYYRSTMPMLERFLALRAELDPQQIFVSSYWRDHLGIAPV